MKVLAAIFALLFATSANAALWKMEVLFDKGATLDVPPSWFGYVEGGPDLTDADIDAIFALHHPLRMLNQYTGRLWIDIWDNGFGEFWQASCTSDIPGLVDILVGCGGDTTEFRNGTLLVDGITPFSVGGTSFRGFDDRDPIGFTYNGYRMFGGFWTFNAEVEITLTQVPLPATGTLLIGCLAALRLRRRS